MPFAPAYDMNSLHLPLSFADNSTSAVGWAWNFGDGGTSTGQDPSHTYAQSGNYTVSLTVSNSFGCTNTATQQVTVNSNDVAWVLPATFCESSELSFADNSTSAVGWAWNFGDGGTSTGRNPSHTYAQSGNYTVSLTVANSLGCSNTATQQMVVHPNEVTWNLPENFCEGTALNFSDNSTSAVSWAWNFGDGTTGTNQNSSHMYANEGTYEVSLTVTNSFGCTNTATQEVMVKANEVGWTLPTAICENATVNFANNNSEAASWAWDFGDDNTSSDQNPSHTYGSEGTYTVTLTVTNQAGCTKSISDEVVVNENDIMWTIPPPPACTYTTLAFADNSTSASGWAWSFGDGTSSDQQSPSHEYTSPGEYKITLTVNNAFGCSNTVSEVVEIGICVGLETGVFNDQVELYPNPSEGMLSVDINWTNDAPGRVSILTPKGEMVFSEIIQKRDGNAQTFDVSKLTDGLYFVRVELEEGIIVKKLIIRK